MELNLAQKHLKIQQWLEETLGKEAVTEYEINTTTVGHLHQLMEASLAKKKSLILLLQDLERKTLEYESEARTFSSVLEGCLVTEGNLSAQGRAALDTVVAVATDLDLKDTSHTSFVLGMVDYRRQQAAVDCQLSVAALKDREGAEKRVALRNMKSTLAESLVRERREGERRRARLEEAEKKTEFLRVKSKQYSRQADALKKQLQLDGYDPAMSHQALLKRAQDIEEKKARLESVEKQLSAFRDLPLDVDLSRLKVEETKRELAALREELSQKIQQNQFPRKH